MFALPSKAGIRNSLTASMQSGKTLTIWTTSLPWVATRNRGRGILVVEQASVDFWVAAPFECTHPGKKLLDLQDTTSALDSV